MDAKSKRRICLIYEVGRGFVVEKEIKKKHKRN
jgi:hypothetical protein